MTVLDPALQLADRTRMTMTAVAHHPVDTAPAEMATATEAHLAVDTTTMTADVTVHLQELVALLRIILLLVDGSMILIAATTLLTHTSMADLHQGTTRQGIIHQESAGTPTTTLQLVTSKHFLYNLKAIFSLTRIRFIHQNWIEHVLL